MSTVPLAPWLAHRPRRGATAIDTVVLHFSNEPDFVRLVDELRQAGHSYHYVIDLDGTVHKCVPYSAVAFHAGNSYGPHEAARGLSAQQDARHHFVECTSVNEYTIAVCLMCQAESASMTKEQMGACKTLLQDLKATPLPKLQFLTTQAWIAPGQAPECASGEDLARLSVETELAIWLPQK